MLRASITFQLFSRAGTMPIRKSFHSLAEAVQSWIDEKNFDLTSAARELGVSVGQLHNILRRGKLPQRETLFHLAKIIGISNTHAYILAELSRPDTPDRIIELLNFYYEKTIEAPDLDVEEVVKEIYPLLDMPRFDLEKDANLLKRTLMMLIRLKWTTEYWDIAQGVIRSLLSKQDEHILRWSLVGQEEYLGTPKDFAKIMQQFDRNSKKGVKIAYLDRKESPRGYVMSAVSIPRGYGAFEPGTATTYGFEMGMVMRGEGVFLSKGLRKDERFSTQQFKEMMSIVFSRHRSHCIFVTSDKLELLNIQIPFAAGHSAKPPVSFRLSRDNARILYNVPTMLHTEGRNGRDRVTEFRAQGVRLPEDLEKLVLGVGSTAQQ